MKQHSKIITVICISSAFSLCLHAEDKATITVNAASYANFESRHLWEKRLKLTTIQLFEKNVENPRDFVFRSYNPYISKARFELNNVILNESSYILLRSSQKSEYLVWPDKLNLHKQKFDLRIQKINDIQTLIRHQIDSNLDSLSKISNKRTAYFNLLDHHSLAAIKTGIDIDLYKHETNKYLSKKITQKGFSRLTSNSKIQPKDQEISKFLHKIWLDIMRNGFLSLKNMNHKLSKTAYDPCVARTLQGANGWIQLTKGYSSGEYISQYRSLKQWPSKKLYSETFKLHFNSKKHACLEKNDFEDGLSRIWSCITCDEIQDIWLDRIKKNIKSNSTPSNYKKKLSIYMEIKDKQLNEVNLIDIEKSIDGLRYIYSDTLAKRPVVPPSED